MPPYLPIDNINLLRYMNTILRYITALGLVLLTLAMASCERTYHDSPDEDYSKLFPFGGIAKPEVDDAIILKQCDPKAELALGIYDPEGDRPAKGREYDVTIKYSFRETAGSGELVSDVSARFLVRYLDAQGKYVLAGSRAGEEGVDEVMENGKEYTVTYRARSGGLLYISADGVAPRGSSIKVSASATSVDGLIVVPALGTHQFQNNEGPNPIQYPYCEYIILP